jgi:hypothetical protein
VAGLWDAANRAELQVGKVLGKAPRKQADVPKGDLIGEFAANVSAARVAEPWQPYERAASRS